MTKETFAVLNNETFDLADIESDIVLIDDGDFDSGFFPIAAQSFKDFMAENNDWIGTVEPYDADGETTAFGEALFHLDAGTRLHGEEWYPHDLAEDTETWVFRFDCDDGHWNLDYEVVS